MWEQKYFAFFFHTLLVTLALMPAEWLYEKLLTEFEVQHELMILTVTGMSKSVGIVCIWRTWWAIIWSSHTNTYLYIFVQVHLEKFFSEILITIHVYNKSERISGIVLEYVVLTFICIVSVVE